ncbi:hypothetical protein ACHAP3_005065 [Botrytis cinerea]
MSQYSYSTDPLDSDSIRLLGLMPDKDLTSPIHCRLHDYSLRESDRGIHLYEALSYVWGSLENLKVVYVNNRSLSVTANLYAALLHLRDRNFERIIWVDSICINQEDNTEKSHQIQLMAKIFGLANRVIVYLGEAADDSDQALESIRVAAEDESAEDESVEVESTRGESPEAESEGINETSQRGILKLLKRPWFQRIWVLQEVGFAQQILIMCGSATIDGHTFSIGFGQLFYKDHSQLPNLIRPVIYLIRGAIFRPKYAIRSSGALSLGALVDMYHTRLATKRHDKIYALLSMSSGSPNLAGLSPDYMVTWTTLLKRLVKFILFKDVSVKAWEDKEIVLIESKGYVIGHVSSIDADSTRYDRQYVSIVSNNQSEFDNEEHTTRWLLHASAKPIRQGDLVCLLQGASKPSIIRAYKDHFSIIVIAVTLQDKIQKKGEWFKSLRPLLSTKGFSRDFLLIWNWEKGPESLQGQVEDEDITERYTSMPEYPKMGTNKTVNSINVALALGDTRNYEKAKYILQIQVANYEGILERESLDMLALKESLAWIYREKNEQMLAENLFLQVIETRKGFQGINHRATLSSMARLGLVYMLAELSPQNHREFIIRLSNQIENNDQISEEDMIQVGNLRSHKMMELLLELKRDNVEVTEEVVKAAASNYYEESIMKLILEKRGEEIIITEEVLKAATSNEYKGKDIMEFILVKRGEEIIITEEILKAAASNKRNGKDIMELILEKRGEVIITEEVLKAAASNYYGESIIKLILEKQGEAIITEEVLKAAVSNQYNSKEIIELILEKREEVIITEEILKAAVSNYWGDSIIKLILEKREEVIITEEILKAAVSNKYYGEEIIELILEKQEEVIITEEVLEAARKNTDLKPLAMTLLLEHQAKHAIVPKKRIKTATTDE